MARRNEDLLQRYLDGELSGRARSRVQRRLEVSEEQRAELERLRRVGELVREAGEQRAEQFSFDGFRARVEEGIRRQHRPGLAERVRIWMGEVFDHRRAVWVPSAAVAGAAAVLLAVLPLMSTSRAPEPAIGTEVGIRSYSAAAEAPSQGTSEIVSVSGATRWAPYKVKNDRGERMAVAWITE
ncbi:MAG: hypothetical protein R6V85_16555 [Polyangia bacterium]